MRSSVLAEAASTADKSRMAVAAVADDLAPDLKRCNQLLLECHFQPAYKTFVEINKKKKINTHTNKSISRKVGLGLTRF